MKLFTEMAKQKEGTHHYGHTKWQTYRLLILEADGYACTRCGTTAPKAVLQVHHKYYKAGRLPWGYPLSACMVLCKTCHGAHHGKVQPQKGWSYMGYDYCQKGRASCGHCQTKIKHCFFIFHPQWGTLMVGTICADRLTATAFAKMQRQKEKKRALYLKIEAWSVTAHGVLRRYKGREILAWKVKKSFRLTIDGVFGKRCFTTLEAAQSHAFEILHDGVLDHYEMKQRTKRD